MTPGEPEALRVLMINAYHTGGGAGRFSQQLATWLRAEGCDVRAYARANPAGDPACHRGSHWRLDSFAARLAAAGLPELGQVGSLLWRCRPEFAEADVLHWQNLHGEYLSLLALPLWGRDKPIVWTLHDMWPLTGNCATPLGCQRWRRACGHCPLAGVYPMSPVDRSRFYRWLKPRLIAAARPRLVTPSRWLADRVAAVPQLARLPVRVIPHAVDTVTFNLGTSRGDARRRWGLNPDRLTVVMAGANWSDPKKGGAEGLAAVRACAARVTGLQLLIVGAGADRLLCRSGVSGAAVPFVDRRADLALAYRAGDVCLFPSRAENYPLTVLEAQACGTPVVAFNVGGVAEQVVDGVTGRLVDDGAVGALTAALRSVLESSEATGMPVAARAWVERHASPAIVTRAYLEEYQAAIAAWRRRHPGRAIRWRRGPLARAIAARLGWERRVAADAAQHLAPQGEPDSVGKFLRPAGPRTVRTEDGSGPGDGARAWSGGLPCPR